MNWDNIISFTDHNTAYRFRIKTVVPSAVDSCQVFVEELDESDQPQDEFSFVYNVALDSFIEETALNEKPIRPLLSQMMEIEPDPKKW